MSPRQGAKDPSWPPGTIATVTCTLQTDRSATSPLNEEDSTLDSEGAATPRRLVVHGCSR